MRQITGSAFVRNVVLLVAEEEGKGSKFYVCEWEGENSYVIFEPQIYILVVQLISVVLKAGSG